MNFTWANQLAKTALKTAQKRIDSVLDITAEEESDENDVPISGSSHSRFDALPEEDEGEGSGGEWDEHEPPQIYSSFSDVPQEREAEADLEGKRVAEIRSTSPSHEWRSQWTEQSDENDVPISGSSHSRFDALPEEDEGEGSGGEWDEHEPPQIYSSFSDVPQEREAEADLEGKRVAEIRSTSPSHEWRSQWTEQEVGVVDSEPNPIRDSHHAGSYQHSPSSNSPDEGCSGGDEHEIAQPDEREGNAVAVLSEAMAIEADEVKNCHASEVAEEVSSQGHHHDETLTIASSDIEVLRQGDSWSIMSMASSALPKEAPIIAVSESISLQPHLQQQVANVISSSETTQQMEAEIAQLRSHIQHQERRIGDLLAQNQKLEKKSHDLLALKAARNKQSSTEAKLMKKLSEKEAELASLLQEGEKLAETNGKLSKELKRLRVNLAEQEQLAKKGAQAEIDRDLANEQLRGLNAENAKLRATIKSMEADSSKVKAADEILVNDLKRRDEKIEKLTSDLQSAEAAREAANEEIRRLQSTVEQISSEADEREISSKGVEEITRATIKSMEADSSKVKAADEILVNDLKRRDEKIEKLTSDLQSAEAAFKATIKSMEADSSKVKAADEILVNDLKRRDEKIEKLTSDLQSAEAAREAANEEIRRLQSTVEQISSEADEREISSKGVEEITRGLSAAVEEERQKNERQASYIESLEKRLAEMMEVQRGAAEMIAMANSPLLESIRQMEADAKSKEAAHDEAVREKDLFIAALAKAKDELMRQNKELSTELTMVRSGRDETSHAMIEVSEKLRSAESENRSLHNSLKRSERLVESLKASIGAKEVEVDKLYVRLRQEAENAERQLVEKQQQIERLSSRCSELDNEMSSLRKRTCADEPAERKRSNAKPKISLNMNTSGVEQLPYISPAAAQTELAEVMMKYEQSMRQVSSLQARLASVQEESHMLSSLRKEFQDLRMRYESLLEAHGEKIERIEELELDLADVKKLFRDQVKGEVGKATLCTSLEYGKLRVATS
ncbi:hypothetical protein Tcan_10354 [Toxocara canis]|uniref:TATA element modulatory factor 1 TATA binding domain-containing protein n=1 Tax=Toxocara canis TaxID=6265 RepID=A0A0B2VWN8_TOXCA|nr:hypothetical protein Tcan_10354 [Toxocara canis]